MEKLRDYVLSTLGYAIQSKELRKQELDKLPFYIKEAFLLRKITLLDRDVVIAEATTEALMTIKQIEKQFNVIQEMIGKPVVLLVNDISSVARKRLVEKGINFIVPNKQLFLPTLLIDLKESFNRTTIQKTKILPSAQLIVLYKILNRNERIEEYTFKGLANHLQYTPMAITKAVANLVYHKLCEVSGTKEKYLQFQGDIPDLWKRALPLLVTPVLRQAYVDEIPEKQFLLKSNVSALPEYSDMNESRQEYYAIEKGLFYNLQKTKQMVNMNDHEGRYCLEVWKYNPAIPADALTKRKYVDPLSLYLSLKNNHDERIQTALDNIIKKNIW